VLRTYKRYLLFTFLSFGVFTSAIIMIINLLIDPYREFEIFSTRKFSSSPDTGPFKAFTKLRTDSYILVFGTSHSATLSQTVLGDKVLNLSTSVYGYPVDAFYFINGLTKQQSRNIKRIYFLVDHFALKEVSPRYRGVDFNSYGDFLHGSIRNIGPIKILHSLDTVIKTITKHYSQFITENGEVIVLRERKYSFLRGTEKVRFASSKNQAIYLRKIADYCKAKGIEIVFFNSILSKFYLEQLAFESIEDHFVTLLDEIDEIYSLMYVDGASDELNNFRDPSHHIFKLTKLEAEILLSEERRERFRINRDNLQDYLRWLKEKI